MVERIPHRDLRNRSSEILREVAAGATYEITNHGEVVAVLSPPPVSPFDGLDVRPAKIRDGFRGLPPPAHSEVSSAEVLEDLRSEWWE